MKPESPRRNFFSRLLAFGAAAPLAAQTPRAAVGAGPHNPAGLGNLYRARTGTRRRESSHSRTGDNADRVSVAPGGTAVMADLRGSGCIRHIWVTIASNEPDYLRRLVFRAYWDGETSPSIETPVGDFFGVGHARVSNYWSLPLNMVTGAGTERSNRAAMNCFFPMPFGSGARITIENQGEQPVGALYYYVDYEAYPNAPADALRFHAQWRRQNPTIANPAVQQPGWNPGTVNELPNTNGRGNYVIMEASGRGHYVGCNLSVDHINPLPMTGWFGEGDDMIFIDGDTTPTLIGTGTEDYFCAAWGYPGGHNSMPYHGISLAGSVDGSGIYSGKWTMYRYHVEDPVMFEKSLKMTIEVGHANAHANDVSSVGYWYQTEPHGAFPALAAVSSRLPLSELDSLRRFWKTR